MNEGIIYECVGGIYTVKLTDGTICRCKARGVFRKDGTDPVAGDKITVVDNVITDVLPRKNSLIRPPVANIDKLFIIIAVTEPEPSLYIIDKLLTVSAYHSIQPVIIFTKYDLGDTHNLFGLYSALPYTVYAVSAKEGLVQTVKDEISNNVCVMTGLSGVGKSTLLNALDPSLCLETGDLSKKIGRGRNTTRVSRFYDVAGGTIADTPGFSSLSVEAYELHDRALLADCFPEFSEHYGSCRFSDCSHTREPDCGIKKAVEEGKIPRTRHENYVRMYEELGVYEEWKLKKGTVAQ